MSKSMGFKNRVRSGFTLVELLVVISIIGILMALLIPAVNAARETARRNTCSTQLNNLSKAVIQYEMAKKAFPGWINNFGTFEATSPADPSNPEGGTMSARHKKLGSWVVSLLPSLDAQPTYEIWTQDKYPIQKANGSAVDFTDNSAPALAILQCPSATTLDSRKAPNSYISNNGMHHLDSSGAVVARSNANNAAGTPSTPATSITLLVSMKVANGVFNNKYAGTAPTSVGPGVSLDDMADGQGNTVLFSESLNAIPWSQFAYDEGTAAAALTLAAATDTEVAYPANSRFAQGMVWHYEDEPSVAATIGFNGSPLVQALKGHKINGQLGTEDILITRMNTNVTNHADIARPSSSHADGVNMAFADGTTRFVTSGISYRVYQALMTPRGKSSDVPFREYVMPGDAL